MANTRTYEVVVIVNSKVSDDDTTALSQNLGNIVTSQGGSIVKSESMGRKTLAYPIEKMTEGNYWLFEIEGSGQEIAELERRMRVNEDVVRYMTVRVDLDRRRAEKFKAKRAARAERRGSSKVSETADDQLFNEGEGE